MTLSLGGPSARRSGVWVPLPYIYSGLVVHPFHPVVAASPASTPDKHHSASHRHRFSWSGFPGSPGDETLDVGRGNAYEVSLDVGDEFFAFEEYQCTVEEDGLGSLWYRGYVVQAVSLTRLMPSGPTSTSQFPHVEPSVLIGIFPAAAVAIRQNIVMENDVSSEAYERAQALAEARAKELGDARGMSMVREEDEDEIEGFVVEKDELQAVRSPKRTSRALPDVKRENSLRRPNRPKSLVLSSTVTAVEQDKVNPPLPQLTAGDSTAAGQRWPLVDEIACAIREWYARLPTYLANREYRLFNAVVQHIDALFLGRRQLLSQMLTEDELVRVRRECVSRLVKCNVAQGLEVIVRSLEDGSIVVVDKDKALGGSTRIGGIPAYVYQVQLAYIDLIPLDTLFGKTASRIPRPLSALKTPAPFITDSSASSVAYQLLLDFRAFIANPCAPGETVELYFSLCKNDGRFLTEEFCLVLNHLGSPARDAEARLGRVRALFADLRAEDVGSGTYLVCRLVRNGAMKMTSDASSGSGDSLRRPPTQKRNSGIFDSRNWRSSVSVAENATDDSFSVTSGFGGHRTATIETFNTTTQASVIGGRPSFRRPLGCAVLELPPMPRLVAEGSGDDYVVAIYVPRDEANYSSLHEDIIHRREAQYEKIPRAESIAIGLKLFQGAVDQITREHPSLLLDVPRTLRLGFSDIVFPGTVRNDVYVKLWSAAFVLATPSTGSLRVRKPVTTPSVASVQVSLEVRKADGTVMSDVLFAGGSGEPPLQQYHSIVFYHNERPTFGELIKISLPANAPDCHLFLALRARSRDRPHGLNSSELEKPFAFGYLPLLSQASSVQDGSHELALYRMDKALQPAPNLYFFVPATADSMPTKIPPQIAKSLSQTRDRLTLRTFLCSTVHTQNETVQALFNWQQLSGDASALCQTLQMFSFVDEDEIAKFIRSVLDALFGILVSNIPDRREEIDDLAFKGLVKVLSMSSDRRYTTFDAVLSSYISAHFSHAASALHLLGQMKAVMARPESKDYRALLKVWHLLFRFIIRARELDRQRGIGADATSAHVEAEFKRQTRAIFDELNTLMLSTNKALIGSQTLAVQHYADVLPDLAQVFPLIEIAEMVIEFTDKLSQVTGNLAVYKLLLLLQVVKILFDTADTRAMLIPAMVRWVKPHIGRFEEEFYSAKNENQVNKDMRRIKWMECNRLAVTVVAWTVNKLQEWRDAPVVTADPVLVAQEEDNIEYCLTLLPPLLVSYKELASETTVDMLNRHRGSPNVWKSTPDVFPMTHPFALVSHLPPPSLVGQDSDDLPATGTFNCGLAEITAVIFTLVLSTPRANIIRWFLEMLDLSGTAALSVTLNLVFDFCHSVIRFEAFPRQWLTLSLMCFGGVVRLMDPIAEVLKCEAFIPGVKDTDNFDTELWTKCFRLLCDLCGHDELALEDQSLQKRRAAWIIAGDVRDEGARLLHDLWNSIGWEAHNGKPGSLRYGGYQTQFISLADVVLTLCMSTHDRLCETAVEVLFSMIYAEYMIDNKFTSIETIIFSKLDSLFTRSAPTSESAMRAYFVAQLRGVFEAAPHVDPAFTQRVSGFLDAVELFIDLLMAVRDLPETPEWKDERASATVRLMDFFKRINRIDLYIRFIHVLVAINLEGRDWLGAGLALKLHADLYEWTLDGERLPDFIEGNLELPAQTQFERKEALLYHALDYLAEAEAYEFAVTICQELVLEHQRLTYDVARISELLAHQARLWERMGTSSRTKPDYFRVAYYGPFTTLNKGKEFVVRGAPWQRYADFCETIQAKYPNATIHRSKIPPPESVRTGSEECIWITSVSPVPDLTAPMFRELVNPAIQAYWKSNGINVFESQRPYIVDPEEKESVLQWIEKTRLTTAEQLPGLLNRSEVVQIRHEHISPLDAAIEQVRMATTNLQKLATTTPPDVKLLGTALNGAVDSRVNGGIPVYRKSFLQPIYLQRRPMDAAKVDVLRNAIMAYVQTIQLGLAVHQRHNKDIAFHEALRTLFAKAYAEELATLPRTSMQSSDLPSQRPQSVSDSRRSTSSYILPPLRLGPDHAVSAAVQSMSTPGPARNGGIVVSLGSDASPSIPSVRVLDTERRASGASGASGVATTDTRPPGSPATVVSRNASLGSHAANGTGNGTPSGLGAAGPGILKRTPSTKSAKSAVTEDEVVSVQSGKRASTLQRFGSLLKR
ncbi:Deoxycytidine kinase 1 [Cryptotrichosporon argae]